MAEISKIYSQYQSSLTSAQDDFEERLKQYAGVLKDQYGDVLKDYIYDFSALFAKQVERQEIKNIAERFLGSSDIPFVAIDGSCHKNTHASFISFYGGAYGAKGTLSLSGPGAKLRYHRWELNRDVSMVAFVPIPPDTISGAAPAETADADDTPPVLTDSEISEFTSYHTKIMQLAEVYLAYSLARASSIEAPRLILIDNSLSGILGNTSFSPSSVRLTAGDFSGESLSLADLQIALAHPINKNLDVPSTKKSQPHFRVIAEASWKESKTVRAKDCPDFPLDNFRAGCRFLSNKVGAGVYDEANEAFEFKEDPRSSWRRATRVFEFICEKLLREKDPLGLTYRLKESHHLREYLTPRDVSFLIGVGIRSLIETCWSRKILLVGVVKDSSSRFFYRNFLGSMCAIENKDPGRHLSIPLTDRSIIEMLPNLDTDLKAPWGTVDFDGCFMTLHPEYDQATKQWFVKGYEHPALGEVTRPERIFLRSLAQFFLTPDGRLASHALFIDRLAYPGWDDKESGSLSVTTRFFGGIKPLFYQSKRNVPSLQKLSMYLLTVLVRNHFPEALGYPDPLHQADWGAKSMRDRIVGLLNSSELAFRSRPLAKTFREIRDSYGR